MTTFRDTFGSYSTGLQFVAARDAMLKSGENRPLYQGATLDPYGQSQNDQTIGYGYDLSQNRGSDTIATFDRVGIALTPAQRSFLSTWNPVPKGDPRIASLDAQFTGKLSITEPQASALLDAAIVPRDVGLQSLLVANGVAGDALTFATGNTDLHALLVSIYYNSPTLLGSNLTTALA